MKPQRLTREQSRDQTRERLLIAAHRIFLKKGFVAASVEDIAAAAGYTRGAFYSNFRSKSDLLLALLERDHAEVQADFQAIFDGGGTREQMESMSLAYYRTLFQDDEYSLLWGEAKLQAARDAKFRVRFNQFLHGIGHPVQSGLIHAGGLRCNHCKSCGDFRYYGRTFRNCASGLA